MIHTIWLTLEHINVIQLKTFQTVLHSLENVLEWLLIDHYYDTLVVERSEANLATQTMLIDQSDLVWFLTSMPQILAVLFTDRPEYLPIAKMRVSFSKITSFSPPLSWPRSRPSGGCIFWLLFRGWSPIDHSSRPERTVSRFNTLWHTRRAWVIYVGSVKSLDAMVVSARSFSVLVSAAIKVVVLTHIWCVWRPPPHHRWPIHPNQKNHIAYNLR